MTFYFVKFTDKKTKKFFYKFGVTSSSVKERFDSKWDSRYASFDIETIDTIQCDEAEKIEEFFLTMYPKNIYLENYIGVPGGYYDKLSGITEIVVLGETEVINVCSLIDKIKEIDMTASAGFITSSGYMSINREYLDVTEDKFVNIENISYNVEELKKNVTYRDNAKFYRWKRNDFIKCHA
jgi:hypothetical protein